MATVTEPAGATSTGTGSPKGSGGLLRNTWVQALAVVAVLVAGYWLTRWAGGPSWAGSFPTGIGESFMAWLDGIYAWIVANRNDSPLFLYFFNYVSVGLGSAVVLINQFLTFLTWAGVTVLGVLAAWRIAGWRVALVVLATFAVFALTGLWNESMTTLSLIITAVFIALLFGVPLGILAGRSEGFYRGVRPVLDFMQIMPAFAYLLPFVLLFGIGNPAAAVVTAVYALPPVVRITALGIREVNKGAVEATTSLGSTPWQILTKVQLPMAKRTILLGVNQTIMLAVSMVVIASVIGAGGLGDAIFQALTKINVGQAFQAGLAIVMLAIAMDRVTGAVGHGAHTPDIPEKYRMPLLGGGLALVILVVALARLADLGGWPRDWSVELDKPVNALNDSVEAAIGPASAALGTWTQTWVLGPLNGLLTGSPWWLVVLAAAALGMVFAGWRAALVSGISFLAIGLLGVWDNAMDTLSQVLVATVVTIALGVLIGVLMSRSDVFAAILRPVLDFMQTLPPFVYLIPAVALLGLGPVPALAAAVIFALPAVIRLVNDGIRGVPKGTLEAALSQGSTGWQLLTKVELPMARGSLLLAVNQGIILVLSMVVMGALVGAGALGNDVVLGLAQNELGLGLASGLAIVFLGLFLDRVTQGRRAPRA
ncbi:glycine/betaine ABC transporter permease [Nocardiopsis terrae]|uniref:Glycine betaine/proline transport system permease protein n=1 Tax=Nocardiopsis terrae TaxID=372655 RepID=A0ABR9HA19_9ACTN|nr:ABC transporter permease subunit [Nocardiopsis terrae]MBE1455885.1 glycine betaine/proline transport system permease protein [Nocardiopsis terrae]GHC98355.1 glycine/betaine ABC transporter permease [Nocardiopsis terrae]